LYTVTLLAAGEVTIHVETQMDSAQRVVVDEVVHVLRLDDIRFRCYIGPDYSQQQSCASVAAGTPIAIVYDGLAGGAYHDITAAITWAGPEADTAPPACDQVSLPGDSDGSKRCALPAGLTQPLTITVSSHGITRTATIEVL
jgi:hypothetical protein